MGKFAEHYSQEQRDAIAMAYADRGIRPARRVVELAGAGQLLNSSGAPLPSFRTNETYVRDLARQLRRRRAGLVESELGQARARDQIEALRRRLIYAADSELAVLERQKPGVMNIARLAQIARMVREAAALPGLDDPRPPAPGAKVDGERVGGETRGGLAGAILAAARRADRDAGHLRSGGQ